VGIELKGGDELRAKLLRMAERFPEDVARALYAEGSIELAEMKQRTPVETGALRASLAIHKPEIQGRDITVRITAGGPAAPYALYVHENLEADHPVGQAKYMESVINESHSSWTARLAKRLDLKKLLT
jgi:bacteriophage HK97-gp10 putative tail-component